MPAGATWTDLGGDEDRPERSRAALTASGSGPALFDHPLLGLDVAGQRVHLEPDLVAARLAGRFHVVEIKSFAVIDGQADPAKVSAAAIQSAVYVLARVTNSRSRASAPESGTVDRFPSARRSHASCQ